MVKNSISPAMFTLLLYILSYSVAVGTLMAISFLFVVLMCFLLYIIYDFSSFEGLFLSKKDIKKINTVENEIENIYFYIVNLVLTDVSLLLILLFPYSYKTIFFVPNLVLFSFAYMYTFCSIINMFMRKVSGKI